MDIEQLPELKPFIRRQARDLGFLKVGFARPEFLEQAGDDLRRWLGEGRHGGMDGYVAAKREIFARPAEGGGAVIGMDDHHCRGIGLELMMRGGLRIIPISGAGRSPGGVYVDSGMLIDDMDYGQARVLDLGGVGALPGRHNGQNAAAAYAAARLAGIEPGAIVDAQLAHRADGCGHCPNQPATVLPLMAIVVAVSPRASA